MSSTTKSFEPSVTSILQEDAVRKLMDRDGQSPDHVMRLLEETARARRANGWAR